MVPKRRRLNKKTKFDAAPEEEAKAEEAPAEEVPAEEAPAAEAPAEEATVEAAAAEEAPVEEWQDASAEDLAWMLEPMEAADSSGDWERLEEARFQNNNCPTEPPRDSNSLQWWLRFLRRYVA